MYQIKIDNFERTHNRPFPSTTSLSSADCAKARNTLCTAFNIDENADDLAILKEMERLSKVTSTNPCSVEFSLLTALRNSNVPIPETVLINWDRFSHIDEMRTADLSEYFADIWYPPADDIEIFDRTGRWFMMVQHWGVVRVAAVS